MELDGPVVGGLIALTVGLVKIIEFLIARLFKKKEEGEDDSLKVPVSSTPIIVQLDPEASRMLREIYERSITVENIVELKDKDGVPMVYSPRSVSENVIQIASIMRDISSSQERILRHTDRVDEKLDEVVLGLKRKG